MKKKERKRNNHSKDNRIAILLYSTISGVSVVFYYATSCWNSCTNKDICYCSLGDHLCSWHTWMNEGKAHHSL